MSYDIAAAFDAGDYMRVALEGREDQWQYHAARGLICDSETSVAWLERFDHPAARFYSAVLAWMAGRDSEALRGLGPLEDDHARNLRSLIAKRQIKVLAQLPPVRHGAHVLADGVRQDRKFKVVNIGYLDGDVPNAPYRSVHDLARSLGKPDFYACYAVEWHQIPTDLQELTCPTIAFTSDFDIHVQSIARWLPVFDHRVVIDHVDSWAKVAAIGRGPTASYPIVFGVPEDLGEFREQERDIDVFVSGTMFSAYHPDKALLMHQLFSIPGIKIVVIDGHVAPDAYMDIMARSKISPTFCRFRGSMQTRVLESLALGAVSLVQPDSIMKLWFDESNGLFEYDEKIGPRPVIERILADYRRIGDNCVKAIATMRQSFAPKSVASRYLRFCTFLAAKPRSRRPALDLWLNQKRVHFAHGINLAPGVAINLAKQNRARLTEEYRMARSARVLIDMAREQLLVYSRALYEGGSVVGPQYLESTIADLRAACADFPNSLVAHFDLLRVLIHFGTASDRSYAETLALKIIATPAEDWRIDPGEDVLPYDLFSNWFDYRAYLDLVVERLAGGIAPDAAFNDLILASVNHYAAVLTGSIEHAERAVALNPSFPFYKLYLAEMLARQPRPDHQEQAEQLLRELAESSIVAMRAYWQLRALKKPQRSSATSIDDLEWRLLRMASVVLQTEHLQLKLASPFFKFENLRAAGVLGPSIHKAVPRKCPAEIAVIVCGLGCYDCETLLSSLHYQEIARSRFELLYVDCYDQPEDSVLRLADWSASLNQRDLLDHRARALAFAIGHCRSQVVVIVTPGEAMAPTFLGDLLKAFYCGAAGNNLAAARSVLVVVPSNGARSSGVRAIAFRLEDYRRVGGLDQREIFMGNDGALDDLAWRLNFDVPTVVLNRSRMVLGNMQPWWEGNLVIRSSHVVEISRKLQPELFNKNLIRRSNLPLPRLLEEHNKNNIVWYNNLYYVTPKRLGAPDWDAIAVNGHPEIPVTASLEDARRIALADRHPGVLQHPLGG